MPDLHVDVDDVVVAGEPGRERVALRRRLAGTHTGHPFMGIAATGRPIELCGIDLLHFEDGWIAGNCIYLTIGKADENDVALPDDSTASRLHAVLEQFSAGWCVTDLGSSNGTWVNGERIWSAHRLRHGDEVRIGQTRLIFRDFAQPIGSATEIEAEALRRGAVSLSQLRAPE